MASVVKFNVSAWLKHTRDMTPLARAVYADVVMRLITLGRNGAIPGPETAGGLEGLSALTGCCEGDIVAVWPQVSERLKQDDAGMYFSSRARDLAGEADTVAAMTRTANSWTKKKMRTPNRGYTKENYWCDPNFSRFWRFVPAKVRNDKKLAFKRWSTKVTPFGQQFIEHVLERWAEHVHRYEKTGEFTYPATWLNARGWESAEDEE